MQVIVGKFAFDLDHVVLRRGTDLKANGEEMQGISMTYEGHYMGAFYKGTEEFEVLDRYMGSIHTLVDVLNGKEEARVPVQPYPFTGNDPDEVYARVRKFCLLLHAAGIGTSPDGTKSITKYYPDHEMTNTTVEVFPLLVTNDQMSLAERIYRDTQLSHEDFYGPVVQAYKQLKPFPDFTLDVEPDGFTLLENAETVDSGIRDWDLVNQVKRVLVKRGLIEAEQTAPSGDDFDPFLDSDDLP